MLTTSLRLWLDLPSGPATPGRDLGDDDRSGYPYLVMAVCGLLGATDCRFHASGFGAEEWYVDVAYDLATVMEAVPEVLDGLRSGRACEMDMYGQGVERTLHFSAGGDAVDVECRSGTSWMPDPAVVRHDRAALIAMVEKLAADFGRAVAIGLPRLAGLEPFAGWRRAA
ncbi:hypothetical protein [Actinoplanes xinjiangensis]|uniref:Uncharacterized protein n=1 Tax=Actinoplanes xinjiangensis TaxID=512350 RepID=A0A316EKZ7_9ACTN|nr:hypothetical protein [Actinoplanes xinjiangensis]PWK32399.1 hypothetical protein BC793_1309 [Actinoplanes xinjiangensis]GIF44537.1 hypothetical protein Axi01nite_88480 [Actinoplanes xinjiangensis]